MKIDIVSVVPKLLDGFFSESILKRGKDKGLVDITVHDLRKWTNDRHKTVDDTPYGGGPGMILKIEPLFRAINELKREDSFIILTTPRGEVFNQKKANEFSLMKHIIIICGHYKGVDERITDYISAEISIGDYILTGGEIAAAVITDAVSRLIDGVISDINSAKSDSFENQLLDSAYYTKPAEFDNKKVPEVLMSGNHKLIEKWRVDEAYNKTKNVRPDLLVK